MNVGKEQLDEAVRRLRAGEPIGFPTETVYGLGAPARHAEAVARLFEIKGRPSTNPLIVHVCDEAMAARISCGWGGVAERLARAFWPGPLSIVVPRSDEIPDVVTAGGATVCVRCPAHPVALALIEALDEPLAGPSANRSGCVSPTTAEHVRAEFPGLFVLDGGPCRVGIESTVVRVLDELVQVLRRGAVTPIQIEAAAGCRVDVLDAQLPEQEVAPSPGMLARHYAPRTRTLLVAREELDRAVRRAGRCVLLVQTQVDAGSVTHNPQVSIIAMPAGAEEYAQVLYDALRRADEMQMDRIIVVRPHGKGDPALWAAICDRLRRASIDESERE